MEHLEFRVPDGVVDDSVELGDVLEEEGRHGEGDLAEDEHRGVPLALALLALEDLEGPLDLMVDELKLEIGSVGARGNLLIKRTV